MKRAANLVMSGVLVALGLSTAAVAQEGPWMVRARVVNLQMQNKSDAIPSLNVPSDVIEVSDKTIPEFDITYFFTPNIAAELVLTIPQKHTVSLAGVGDLGTFKHLPPTLLAQYHFMPTSDFRPYVGAGVNYTRIWGVNVGVPGVGELSLDNDSIGGALQIGFDYKLDKNLFLNVDVKKIFIHSDVMLKANGAKVSAVKLDPLAIGIGIGYRF